MDANTHKYIVIAIVFVIVLGVNGPLGIIKVLQQTVAQEVLQRGLR